MTAFKNDKYLKGIKTVSGGIKINCNAGAVVTNKRGIYRQSKVLNGTVSRVQAVSM